MEQVKIKIEDKEFIIKQNFRGLMLFETMAGKTEPNDTVNDAMLLFYCFLRGANKDTFNYTYDEFIDIIDNDNSIFENFTTYLNNLNKTVNQPNEEKKQKKTIKK